MTGVRFPMAARCATLAAALLLAGCGDEARQQAQPAAQAKREPAAGEFPSTPQVVEDFEDPGSGWPRGGYREGVFQLGSSRSAAVLAPQPVQPATRGTLSEVVLEPSRGGAGLLCRASADGSAGYALLLGIDGRVQLSRIDDGDASVIKEHRLSPNERSERGKASLLRLGCGTGAPGTPVTLIYSVNATPYAHVVDRESVDPGRSAHVGLVTRNGTARFDDFALTLAK